MKKHGVRMVFITVILAVLFWTTAGTVMAEERQPVDLTVGIVPGAEYSHTKWFVVIPMKLTPQMAVWLESADGQFIGTVYVTEKAASGNWRGGKDVSRPEALPVYFHRADLNRSSNGAADTVSGATPKKGDDDSQTWTGSFSLAAGKYRIMAEVNSSFDYNSNYPEQDENVNGQPSLVYAAGFEINESGKELQVRGNREFDLQPVGHGDPTGESGVMIPDLSGMTSALDMLDRMYAAVN